MERVLVIREKRIYIALLAVFLVIYVLGLYDLLLPRVLDDHASNFSLTGAVFVLVTYRPLTRDGTTWSRLGLLFAVFALLNAVVELFVSSDRLRVAGVDVGAFNTTDPLDLLAGLLALVVIAATILMAAERGPRPGADEHEVASQP